MLANGGVGLFVLSKIAARDCLKGSESWCAFVIDVSNMVFKGHPVVIGDAEDFYTICEKDGCAVHCNAIGLYGCILVYYF